MTLRAYRTFQALILALLGIYLLSKVMDGRILFYISQRFVGLVLLAALVLVFLAQLVLRERPAPETEGEDTPEESADHAGHDHEEEPRQGWVLWLVALPLLIGLLVPERPLGASALQNRGINTSAGLYARGGAGLALQIPPNQRSVLDWVRVAQESPDSKTYEGQPADVTGFIYHDNRLGANQFLVSRFTITCCVADAFALGMVVDWPEAASLPDNRWVRVRGPVQPFVLDGKTLPAVTAEQVELVPEPELPYLFP